jgi:hypothetical protein
MLQELPEMHLTCKGEVITVFMELLQGWQARAAEGTDGKTSSCPLPFWNEG